MAPDPDAPAPQFVARFVAPVLGLVTAAACAPAVRTADPGEVLADGVVVVGLIAVGLVAASAAFALRWARSRSGETDRSRGTAPASRASWGGMPELDREVRALSAMVRRDRSIAPVEVKTADDDGAVGSEGAAVGDRPVADEPAARVMVNGARSGALTVGSPVAVPLLAWPPAQRAGGLMIDGSEVAGGVDDDGGPEPFGGSLPASADGPPVGVDGGSPSAPAPDAPAGAGLGAAHRPPPPDPPAPSAPGRFTIPPGALRWSTDAGGPALAGVHPGPPAASAAAAPEPRPPVVRPDLPPPPAPR